MAQRIMHGFSKTKLYNTWGHIKDRCNNPKDARYKWYGARGIRLCKEWSDDFAVFKLYIDRELGVCPAGYSLDRIDNDGSYEPGNIRWASLKTQNENKRTPCSRIFLTYNNETKSLSQWAKDTGIKKSTIEARRYAGDSITDIFRAVGTFARHRTVRGRKHNVFLTHNGNTLTQAQWAKKLGISSSAIKYRIKKQWPIEKIFSPRGCGHENSLKQPRG